MTDCRDRSLGYVITRLAHLTHLTRLTRAARLRYPITSSTLCYSFHQVYTTRCLPLLLVSPQSPRRQRIPTLSDEKHLDYSSFHRAKRFIKTSLPSYFSNRYPYFSHLNIFTVVRSLPLLLLNTHSSPSLTANHNTTPCQTNRAYTPPTTPLCSPSSPSCGCMICRRKTFARRSSSSGMQSVHAKYARADDSAMLIYEASANLPLAPVPDVRPLSRLRIDVYG